MLQILRGSTRHPITKIFLGLVVISFGALGLGSFIPSMQRWLLSMRVDDWMIKMPEETKPIYKELMKE